MLANSALALLARRGQPITHKRKSGATYDTATGTKSGGTILTQTLTGKILNYSIRDRANGLILEGDRRVVLAASGATRPIKANDTLTYDDILTQAEMTLFVVDVQVIDDKGVPVVYVCQARES